MCYAALGWAVLYCIVLECVLELGLGLNVTSARQQEILYPISFVIFCACPLSCSLILLRAIFLDRVRFLIHYALQDDGASDDFASLILPSIATPAPVF